MFTSLIRKQYTYFAVGGAALTIGKGTYDALHNAHLAKKNEEALKNLNTPFYKIQDEFYQNKNIAAAQAGQGLPQSTQDYYASENSKAFGSGIDALLKGGADSSAVTSLFDTFNKGVRAVGAEDAAMHQSNIEKFMSANSELAGQKITQWTLNEKQPYEQKLAELNQKIQTNKANENTGFNEIVGGVAAAGTGLANNKLLNAQTSGYEGMSNYYNQLFGSLGGVRNARAPQQGTERIFSPVPASLPAGAQPTALPDFNFGGGNNFIGPNPYGG